MFTMTTTPDFMAPDIREGHKVLDNSATANEYEHHLLSKGSVSAV